MNTTGILVLLHIAAGSVAVAGMIIAMVCKKGGLWHKRGGKAYVSGMALALLLATIVSVLTGNIFLFLVGLFSGYFVFTGWRIAAAQSGLRSKFDQSITWGMLLVSALMVAYGIFQLATGATMGIALLVFGVFAALPAWEDLKLGGQWPKGKERIKLHLGRMGGASIATLTAVFVVNVKTDPDFIAWLLPSIVITPVIIYWSRRVGAGRAVV